MQTTQSTPTSTLYGDCKLLGVEHDKVALLFHLQLDVHKSGERKPLQIDVFVVDSVPNPNNEDISNYLVGTIFFGSLTE